MRRLRSFARIFRRRRYEAVFDRTGRYRDRQNRFDSGLRGNAVSRILYIRKPDLAVARFQVFGNPSRKLQTGHLLYPGNTYHAEARRNFRHTARPADLRLFNLRGVSPLYDSVL